MQESNLQLVKGLLIMMGTTRTMIEEELIKIAPNTAPLTVFLVCYANRIEDAALDGEGATPTFRKIPFYSKPGEVGT